MKRLLTLAFALLIVGFALMPGGRTERTSAAPYGAAYNMYPYNVTCTSVALQWTPSGFGAQQWVDLSHWNGYYWQWDEGGPLGTYTNSFQWNSLIPGTTYYVRIDTGTWDGYWLASDWVRFDTPYCGPGPGPVGGSRCGGGPVYAVCTNRGTNGLYVLGEAVTICYDVPAYGTYVYIRTVLPNGQVNTLFQPGYDDGRGDCQTGTAGGVLGRRDVYFYNQAGQVVASTYYRVGIQ
jgi:hypothetical protein